MQRLTDIELKRLDEDANRAIYVRATLLGFDGTPLEKIEGRTKEGSISVDGNSAVRRTCQLTLIMDGDTTFTDYYWTMKSKFKLEVGVKVEWYKNIIWFKQGEFIISSFSQNRDNAGAITVQLQGRDKMAMLNGDLGGVINSPVDFGTIEFTDENGITAIEKQKIYDIIREAVHTYGNEPFHNIIINDLDEVALALQEYRYLEPMYLWRKWNKDIYENGTLDGSVTVYQNKEAKALDNEKFEFEDLSKLSEDINTTPFTFANETPNENNSYIAAKIEAGDACGYTETDLTYPGDLIANAGETVVAVLDKIKNFLGDFEYFYDIDGRFIFQKKKNYVNTSFTPIVTTDEGAYVDFFEPDVYRFEESKTITNIAYTPDITNVKNDFTVWGTRKGTSGANIPIHMRYAIHRKPYKYTTIAVDDEEVKAYNEKYNFNLKGQKSIEYTENDWDWRELIYRMAIDYRKYNHLDNFEAKVAAANPDVFPTGKTGYEQFYIDMEGFWRQLYNPDNEEWPNGNNPDIENAPQNLNFWIDFLDTAGELDKFSIENIGSRQKTVSDQQVKAIHYKDTPLIIFGEPGEHPKTGYRYFNVGKYNTMFSMSAQGKSAKTEIENLLYKHGYCSESLSITAIPIYYLEPNNRIYIKDTPTGIDGSYLFTQYTIPLTYNGTMQITATKVADRLL